MEIRGIISSFFLLLFIFCCSSLTAGCGTYNKFTQSKGAILPDKGAKVVIGFKSVIRPNSEYWMTHGPLAEAIHSFDTVDGVFEDQLSKTLYLMLKKDQVNDMINPSRAEEVYIEIINSNPDQREIDILYNVGKRFSADYIVSGYIYRWNERKGGDFSVERPASVAFDLYLIRTKDKAVLWRGFFDKSQKSLTENLLDIKMFIKGKGRWLRAMELAEIGVAGMLDELN